MVPESMFARVRPKAGTNLTASIVPHGGRTGKAILGIVIGILIVVSAVYGGIAAYGALEVGASAAGVYAGAAAGVIGGLATIAGGVYSLVSPPPSLSFGGDGPTSNKSYSIQGTRNNLRPYDPIPTVFGQYRMFPPHLAKPYTEIIGGDTYLRVLLTFGYGPLLIDAATLKIGETSFASYDLVENVDYKIHQGWDDDPTSLEIFTDEVDEEVLGAALTDGDGLDADGSQADGSPTIQTSTADASEISLDFVFPAGLFAVNDKGKSKWASVWLSIEFRCSDMGSVAPWTGIGPGAWETTGRTFDSVELPGVTASDLPEGVTELKSIGDNYNSTHKFSGKERGRMVRGLRFSTANAQPASGSVLPGQTYDVRIVRTNTKVDGKARILQTNPKQDNQFTDMTWTMLRSIKPYTVSPIANLSKLELRIKATDRLSGFVDTVNAEVQSILPVFDQFGVEWGSGIYTQAKMDAGELEATSSPAWAFAHVLRGPQNSRPVTDDEIDSNQIFHWDAECKNGGIGGFLNDAGVTPHVQTFNAVVDSPGTTLSLLNNIAGGARASFNITDGKYGVVLDEPVTNEVVIQHFTPRNSHGFEGKRTYKKTTQALRVNFINPALGWRPDEIIVYNDGFNEDGAGDDTAATVFQTLDLWGCTDADQAYRDARYHMASAQLRPEVYSLKTDAESLACTRGDLVRVTHDSIAKGLFAARIKSVEFHGGGNFKSAILDEEFSYIGGKAYAIYVRQEQLSSGVGEAYISLSNPGTSAVPTNLIEADDSVSGEPFTGTIQAGDLVLFGEEGSESGLYSIIKISPTQDLGATVAMVDYNPAVYTAGLAAIPPFVSNTTVVTLPVAGVPDLPVIMDITHDESVMDYTGAIPTPRIAVTVGHRDPESDAELSQIQTTHFGIQYQSVIDSDPNLTTEPTESGWRNGPTAEAIGETTLLISEGIESGDEYRVRVRAISTTTGGHSDWVTGVKFTVIGGSTLPPDPAGLTKRGREFTWMYEDFPPDFRGFIFKSQSGSSGNWDTAGPAHAGTLADNRFPAFGTMASGTRTCLVKAVDFFGNESENAASGVFEIISEADENLIRTKDYKADDNGDSQPWDIATWGLGNEHTRWEFDSTVESWSAGPLVGSSFSHLAGESAIQYVEEDAGGAATSLLVSPVFPITGPSPPRIQGTVGPDVVKMRVRQTNVLADQDWLGRLQFATSVQGDRALNAQMFNNRAPDSTATTGIQPAFDEPGGWSVLTWDMSETDSWMNIGAGSTTRMYFQFTNGWATASAEGQPTFEIDWITVTEGVYIDYNILDYEDTAELSGGGVSANLQAVDLGGSFWTESDSNLFWLPVGEDTDVGGFWSSVYRDMTLVTSPDTPYLIAGDGEFPCRIFLDYDITADSFEIEWAYLVTTATGTYSGWMPWPGDMLLTNEINDEARDDSIKFRLSIRGGNNQPVLSALSLKTDRPTVEEIFTDLAVDGGGGAGVVVPVTKTFNTITSISGTVRGNVSGDYIEVVDYVAAGPRIKVRAGADDSSTTTEAVDLVVKGY